MRKNVVRLENSFAEKAQYSLRARSQHLFLYLISLVDTTKNEFEEIVLQVKDIEEILKQAKHNESTDKLHSIKWGNFNEEIKPYLEELKSCTFTIPSRVDYKGSNLPIFTDLFRRIEPCKINNRACYRFIFSHDMKSFLLELTKYVQFKWISIVGIKNVHGIRLYMALKAALEKQKRYRAIVIVKYTIQELRNLFGLDQNSHTGKILYPKTNDFKRYVVERAIVEITEKSDLYVIPNYIKRGRSLTHIEFQITESKYNPNQLTLALNDRESFEYKFLKKISASKRFSDVDLDEVKRCLPLKYAEMKEAVNTLVDESIAEMQLNNIKHFTDDYIKGMKKDHLKSDLLKYARVMVSG